MEKSSAPMSDHFRIETPFIMSRTVYAIVWGGLLCGALDAAAASLFLRAQGVSPIRVWQGVASGLKGESAFRQGWRSVSLGLILHFLIAFVAAAFFCVGVRFARGVLNAPVAAGVLYGFVVFLVMNFIVIPLSARPKRPFTVSGVVGQLLIHALWVGLPISLSASHCLK
jgi:uncharacterized membrane protein YagU involved in acid resistance